MKERKPPSIDIGQITTPWPRGIWVSSRDLYEQGRNWDAWPDAVGKMID
jgi:hypothetical protein